MNKLVRHLFRRGCFMILSYSGDQGSRIMAWFQPHLKSIALTLENGLPEQCLALIYSGIDTWALLAAPPPLVDTTRSVFMDWCEAYILPRVQSVEGEALAAIDLYGARCGVLHTSTPQSALGRTGTARELWYQFNGQTGVRMLSVLPRPALRLDVSALAWAFRDGALACLADIQKGPARAQLAENRAQHFMRWRVVEMDHPPAPVTTLPGPPA
jgi:hypothetical protein